MAENLVQNVQDMLKEETWTRATISNYTQSNLKELADIVVIKPIKIIVCQFCFMLSKNNSPYVEGRRTSWSLTLGRCFSFLL